MVEQGLAGARQADLVEPRRKSNLVEVGGKAQRIGLGTQAEPDRKAEGEDQPDRYRFAMQQAADPGFCLDRMGKAVPEIEQGAAAGEIKRICADEPGLGADAGSDGVKAGIAVASDQRRAVRLAPGEESGIVDQAIFDDFGIARSQLALVQSVEKSRVGDDNGGHVKAADQIF